MMLTNYMARINSGGFVSEGVLIGQKSRGVGTKMEVELSLDASYLL